MAEYFGRSRRYSLSLRMVGYMVCVGWNPIIWGDASTQSQQPFATQSCIWCKIVKGIGPCITLTIILNEDILSRTLNFQIALCYQGWSSDLEAAGKWEDISNDEATREIATRRKDSTHTTWLGLSPAFRCWYTQQCTDTQIHTGHTQNLQISQLRSTCDGRFEASCSNLGNLGLNLKIPNRSGTWGLRYPHSSCA